MDEDEEENEDKDEEDEDDEEKDFLSSTTGSASLPLLRPTTGSHGMPLRLYCRPLELTGLGLNVGTETPSE